MKKIIAFVFADETDIERNDSSEVIRCEEKVDSEPELQEIIKYHWGLDADEYELTILGEKENVFAVPVLKDCLCKRGL